MTLLADRDRFLCEHAKSFDARTPHAKLETSKSRVEMWTVRLGGHISRARKAAGRQSPIGKPMLTAQRSDTDVLAGHGEWFSVLNRLGLLQLLLTRPRRCHRFSPSCLNALGALVTYT